MKDNNRLTHWELPHAAQFPTEYGYLWPVEWLEAEVAKGEMPGRSGREILYERKGGVLTGRIALGRKETKV